jgi:hypothetical protein
MLPRATGLVLHAAGAGRVAARLLGVVRCTSSTRLPSAPHCALTWVASGCTPYGAAKPSRRITTTATTTIWFAALTPPRARPSRLSARAPGECATSSASDDAPSWRDLKSGEARDARRSPRDDFLVRGHNRRAGGFAGADDTHGGRASVDAHTDGVEPSRACREAGSALWVSVAPSATRSQRCRRRSGSRSVSTRSRLNEDLSCGDLAGGGCHGRACVVIRSFTLPGDPPWPRHRFPRVA